MNTYMILTIAWMGNALILMSVIILSVFEDEHLQRTRVISCALIMAIGNVLYALYGYLTDQPSLYILNATLYLVNMRTVIRTTRRKIQK